MSPPLPAPLPKDKYPNVPYPNPCPLCQGAPAYVETEWGPQVYCTSCYATSDKTREWNMGFVEDYDVEGWL